MLRKKEKVLAQEGDKSPSLIRRVFSGPKEKGPPAATGVAGPSLYNEGYSKEFGWAGALEKNKKNKKNRPKLASEKEKVLAQEGDKSPSEVRGVPSGLKKKGPPAATVVAGPSLYNEGYSKEFGWAGALEKNKKNNQSEATSRQVIELRTKLVKDASKKVEGERPNLCSLPNSGKAPEILVDKVKQDKGSLSSPKPASEKAKVDPSLKDKGRAATEQPNNKFEGVRRVHWGLSSSATDKGSQPKSFLRTKHKIFNPLKQLLEAEHRESLVPDAVKGEELELKHREILVPDAVKRQAKPASDILSKSFYRLIVSGNKVLSDIDPLEVKLRHPKVGGKMGDRKYFPAASTE